MNAARPCIVVTNWVHDDVLAQLAAIGDVDANRARTPWARVELIRRAAGADALLAFFLLTAPPGAVEPPPPADQWPNVQAAVQKLAKEWEILDDRETKYILAKADEFGADLNLLRRRYQDLKDTPKVADSPATRMSVPWRISVPPAMALPSTAAMTGLGGW